ncbi:MAG: hypothetical protein J0H08_17490 [Rhizobiales bacterium]|nr:hypothetical protein [Hyphomicrobiales bacterium]
MRVLSAGIVDGFQSERAKDWPAAVDTAGVGLAHRSLRGKFSTAFTLDRGTPTDFPRVSRIAAILNDRRRLLLSRRLEGCRRGAKTGT